MQLSMHFLRYLLNTFMFIGYLCSLGVLCQEQLNDTAQYRYSMERIPHLFTKNESLKFNTHDKQIYRTPIRGYIPSLFTLDKD